MTPGDVGAAQCPVTRRATSENTSSTFVLRDVGNDIDDRYAHTIATLPVVPLSNNS